MNIKWNDLNPNQTMSKALRLLGPVDLDETIELVLCGPDGQDARFAQFIFIQGDVRSPIGFIFIQDDGKCSVCFESENISVYLLATVATALSEIRPIYGESDWSSPDCDETGQIVGISFYCPSQRETLIRKARLLADEFRSSEALAHFLAAVKGAKKAA